MSASKQQNLQSETWALQVLNNHDVTDDGIWIKFHADGSFTGYSGTHAMSGVYLCEACEENGGNLQISRLDLVRKACLRNASAHTEFSFIQAFEAATAYHLIDEETLKLQTADKAGTMLFKPQ